MTKMLKYAILMHSKENLSTFEWQIGPWSYLGDPLSYVLIETRHRKVGTEVDRAWCFQDTLRYPQKSMGLFMLLLATGRCKFGTNVSLRGI
jgi:hypothetical protein